MLVYGSIYVLHEVMFQSTEICNDRVLGFRQGLEMPKLSKIDSPCSKLRGIID